MLVSHWPTGVSCLLANWDQLLICQLISAAHWPTDISCLVLLSAHWLTVVVSCLTVNQYQLLFGPLTSAALCPSDVIGIGISCLLANCHQLLIGQLTSAAGQPMPMSAPLWQTEMLIGKPNATNIKFNSKTSETVSAERKCSREAALSLVM